MFGRKRSRKRALRAGASSSGLCPVVPLTKGASWGDNAGRLLVPRAVVLHRTIGTWTGDFSVGRDRYHSSPGTFNFLVGQSSGQWAQFYPSNVRCSHAADANYAGPGIEFSGQNGEPLTAWQIDAGGQIIRWLAAEHGIPASFYDGTRIPVDNGNFRGFITHRSIQSSLPHDDYVTKDEFTRMVGGAIPSPTPTPEEEEMGFIAQVAYDPAFYYCRANVRTALSKDDKVRLEQVQNLAEAGAIKSVNPLLVHVETLKLYKPQAVAVYP